MNVHKLALVALGVALVSSCSAPLRNPPSPAEIPPWFDSSLDSLVADSLRRFARREELEAYRAELHKAAAKRGAYWAQTTLQWPQVLLASTQVEICDPAVTDCPQLEEVTVTGTRVAPSSITNNQEAGVDEGDIVKQFGRFLIVLQDGRLFSIDTGEAPGTMTFVDRVDVYQSPVLGTWYDELLITDDRLLVTGYDYRLGASELALFRIDSNGVFTYEATFYVESDDYYSGNNYASRVVDGSLVLYTPLYLTEREPDEPLEFPRVRRWTPGAGFSEWEPLFGITDVYLPIQRTLDPVVHTVSVCPLDAAAFTCRSTGIIGPGSREFYVSPEHAYLWVGMSRYELWDWDIADCKRRTGSKARAVPAALYRISLADGRATAVFTEGMPNDQFSLDARESEFLALLDWVPGDCTTDEQYALRYARIPVSAFSSRPAQLAADRYFALPTPPGDGVENRFTEDYLVYGGAQGRWRAYYADEDDDYAATDLIAVPVDAPDLLITVPLAHTAERVEVFGGNLVVDGYRGAGQGLNVSTIDLRRRPHVGDTAYLSGVLESEGRSHAFNGLAETSGGGVFGLPTMMRSSSWRSYSEDEGSNVHFFNVGPALDIQVAGYLAPRPIDDDYECEVSCVDWYGNARPIFVNGRVFALTGSELVEGYFVAGQVLERQRVAITGVPLHRR